MVKQINILDKYEPKKDNNLNNPHETQRVVLHG